MSDEIIKTRPVNKSEALLREKFAERFATQSDKMDKLARQLITLELAIPGLYATVLKLIAGDKATLTINYYFYVTFGCWFVALTLTLISLIPRHWKVDPTILKPDPAGKSTAMGLEQFFYQTALHKRRLLIPAIFLFWLGILSAAVAIL